MTDLFDTRVVNCNFTLDGLHFDAAIDINWQMHAYGVFDVEESEDVCPVELYCYDHKEWDIKVLYLKSKNPQPKPLEPRLLFTVIDWDEIIAGTKEWIEEMKSEKED